MTDLSYKETEKNLYYQMLFRFLVGLAGIATYALLLKDRGDTYHLASLTLTTILYIISTHFLAKFVKKETRVVVASFLPVTDAFLLGAMVGFLSLDLLAILLFFSSLLFNSSIHGGITTMIRASLAAGLGFALLWLLQPFQWSIDARLTSSVAIIIAMVFYICIYELNSFNERTSLQEQVNQLKKQKVQLKLKNYHISKYLSPTLREAISSGKDVKLETQRKQLTVFFSDIKGFSELTEEMEAHALTSLLNNYLTEMSEIALKHGGTIDKFIGDAIMVFFGDPSTKGAKADAVAAVSMAIDMKRHMAELRQRWLNQGIQNPLEIRMGINTGFCTVGNFGTEDRLDYTLLGTEVNLASRLESASEPGEILISHETYSFVKDLIMCRDKGEIQVKGYQQPVRVYSVDDMRKNLGQDQTYFEHLTSGFSVYMDLDRVRNYDKDKILASLLNAAKRLKNKNIF
jgi:class 3 adenylate cyclase